MTRIQVMAMVAAGVVGSPLAVGGRDHPLLTSAQCDAPRTAAPFLPGLADSGRIFRGTLSRDGREFWFFRKVSADPRLEDYRIFVATRGSGGWSEPRRVDLGGDFSDLYPALTADGRRLVFASYRRAPGDTAAEPNASLWQAERRGGTWGPATFIAAATELGHYHSQVTLAANGDLYFRRTTPDWSKTVELVAPARGAGYETERPVEGADRWSSWKPGHYVWGARAGHDGSYMLMEVSTVDSAGRRSPSDLWVTTRGAGGWSEPRPLGAGVNSPQNDNFASVTADGCRLIFTRNFSGFYHVSLSAAISSGS